MVKRVGVWSEGKRSVEVFGFGVGMLKEMEEGRFGGGKDERMSKEEDVVGRVGGVREGEEEMMDDVGGVNEDVVFDNGLVDRRDEELMEERVVLVECEGLSEFEGDEMRV